ncbi:myb-like protein AA [Hyalella azteca]|uniref:Myb-like protein AA n=1 Tax=Hyalella azteca TaxID=294128 RepID=A0A8B7N9Z8_HYAAZ|nr:myb-like protein AA [Hyalella azteca]
MPKRCRSKNNNNNNANDNNNSNNPADTVAISGVSLIIPEEPKALESYFDPNEMKRQIADALKDSSVKPKGLIKSQQQLRSKRSKANINEFHALFGGKKSGKLSSPQVTRMLHYADVVSNKNNKENICELGGKLDQIAEENDVQSLREQMDFAIKDAIRENSPDERWKSVDASGKPPSPTQMTPNPTQLIPKPQSASQTPPQDTQLMPTEAQMVLSETQLGPKSQSQTKQETLTIPKGTSIIPKETSLNPQATPLNPQENPLSPQKTPLIPQETPLSPQETFLIPHDTPLVPQDPIVMRTARTSISADQQEVASSKINSIGTLLGGIDPEVLSELELDDTNWEVISVDGWSHCGSDTEDQFYLISRDDALAIHSFDEDSGEFDDEDTDDRRSSDLKDEGSSGNADTKDDSVNISDSIDQNLPRVDSNANKDELETATKEPTSEQSKKSKGKKNKKGNKQQTNTSKSDTTIPGNDGGVTACPTPTCTNPQKKKKVVVTRKYVGKDDFGEKLTALGFSPVTEAGKSDSQQWSGLYNGNQVMVTARVLCGVLLVTLRAESDGLLQGLTTLQGLTATTGLLSYTNLTLPAVQPAC